MTAFIGNPGDRVLVRISAVREQKGPNGLFMSLSVSDDMEAGFVRIPATGSDIVSFTLSTEQWGELVKLIGKKTGAKFSKKSDKNGKPYQAADRIVRLEIVVSQIKVEDLSRKVQVFTIGGNVVKITTRDKRAGNGIKLED